MQNIPSHNKDIRKLFKAHNEEKVVDVVNNIVVVDYFCKVNTVNGYVSAYDLKVEDVLLFEDNTTSAIKNIVEYNYKSIELEVV